MSRIIQVAVVVCFLTVLSAAPPQNGHVPGRLLVQPRMGANSNTVSQAFSRAGAILEKQISRINVSVLRVPEPALDQVSAALARTGLFTFIEPDYIGQAGQTTGVTPN